MPNIGERLRKAREAIGFSQQELADRCGVTMRSQRNYEKGERSPDAQYLAALAATGANVLYILTGQPVSAQPGIAEPDRILLDNFHAAPEQVQAGVKTTLGAFSPSNNARQRRSKKAA